MGARVKGVSCIWNVKWVQQIRVKHHLYVKDCLEWCFEAENFQLHCLLNRYIQTRSRIHFLVTTGVPYPVVIPSSFVENGLHRFRVKSRELGDQRYGRGCGGEDGGMHARLIALLRGRILFKFGKWREMERSQYCLFTNLYGIYTLRENGRG